MDSCGGDSKHLYPQVAIFPMKHLGTDIMVFISSVARLQNLPL